VTDVTSGAVARILRLLGESPARCGGTKVLAIDGRSGSGKTTLAEALAAELSAPVVSLDYLYGGWDGLASGIELLVSDVLEPLSLGRTALVPGYDWVREAWDEPAPLDPPQTLIVEGAGAGARRAAAHASVLVWLEAPSSVRKKRALDRDGGTFAPHWDRWAAQEDAMLARECTPGRADLVIES
jgi:uridine kinase